MLQRLKQDFYLAMISLAGLIIILFLTPYGIFRLFTGNLVVGIADLVMVAVSLISVLYAWRTGDTVRPGQFMAVAFCIGASLVCINLGLDGLFWVYPFVVFIFFLVPPLKALLLLLTTLSVLIGYGLMFEGELFATHFQLTSFAVTTGSTSFFAYMFAYRTQMQRKALKKLATIDSLTGAANRRTLNKALEEAIAQQQRKGRPYGLMLLDLDYFKQINDNYGHKVGDDILVKLVPILNNLTRQTDKVYRFGGEEFVLLFDDIKPDALHALAEKIRQGVQQQLLLPDGKAVTLSAGLALLAPGENWEAWLHRADMALYQAKHQGRNQVILAD
ncbi:GGDEF domain-containing protein [Arsukibacterium sp.]|uniref:GGDEF domain-containing protein n=1 Tax=Arsukibacterium sp. TaxID=1977258 RepID=UPI002FD96BF0